MAWLQAPMQPVRVDVAGHTPGVVGRPDEGRHRHPLPAGGQVFRGDVKAPVPDSVPRYRKKERFVTSKVPAGMVRPNPPQYARKGSFGVEEWLSRVAAANPAGPKPTSCSQGISEEAIQPAADASAQGLKDMQRT